MQIGPEQHLAALVAEAEMLHWIATQPRSARPGERPADAEHGRLELEDVLGRLDDHEVDAAGEQAGRLLGEHLDQLGERDLAQRRVIAGGQEAGRADRAGDEPLFSGRPAGDLRRFEVDLVGVGLEPPLGELQPRGLEGVSLEHVGAGFEHRRVDALDHVGPVEHQHLVAASGKLVVVLEGQLELLQRGAHPAVVDDRSLVRRGQEVAHPRHATKP